MQKYTILSKFNRGPASLSQHQIVMKSRSINNSLFFPTALFGDFSILCFVIIILAFFTIRCSKGHIIS